MYQPRAGLCAGAGAAAAAGAGAGELLRPPRAAGTERRRTGRRLACLLAHERTAVAAARRIVDAFLAQADRADLTDSAELVVSELVTNAVVHGRPPVCLTLTWVETAAPRPSALHIDVEDHGSTPDTLGAVPPPDAEHGRGLVLVDAIADRWGVVGDPVTGSHVWAELT
ncbi:ATP-binding protein [Streptomyces sp. TRM64462]|uniref:ATP-binding protein n=1 Tax=Streptomyces sp. TRM64462 TaxID=2741726 RepID=UPI00158642F7|nr:ATP-binding protein [Streptomyces sp. TRM64462]